MKYLFSTKFLCILTFLIFSMNQGFGQNVDVQLADGTSSDHVLNWKASAAFAVGRIGAPIRFAFKVPAADWVPGSIVNIDSDPAALDFRLQEADHPNGNHYIIFFMQKSEYALNNIATTFLPVLEFSIAPPVGLRAPIPTLVVADPADAIPSTIESEGSNILALILPVKLTSFKAKKQDNFSSLTWETSSEINNDFFDVERSSNSVDFVSIGRVQGNGTTNATQNYDFLDRNPLSGKNYYRLKQVDYNGAYEYSDIESVDFSEGRGGIQVFPNPTADFITIALDRKYEKIKVLNNLGQLVEIISSTEMGNNQIKVNVSDYTPGIYFIEAKVGTEILNKQFVKIH